MKPSLFVARGGLLTALSVALLLLAAAAPAFGLALCVSAGLIVALPLSKRRVRLGVLVYAATSLLSGVIVPGKRFVAAYVLLFGLYPLLKYGIERLRCLPLEWGLKLLYAGFLILVLSGLLRYGLLSLESYAAKLPSAVFFVLFGAAFVCYDILFSKTIGLFQHFFRNS